MDEKKADALRKFPILRFFEYDHLPPPLRGRSADVHKLAWAFVEAGGDARESAAGLRKLLEAKDCFVRAGLPSGDES